LNKFVGQKIRFFGRKVAPAKIRHLSFVAGIQILFEGKQNEAIIAFAVLSKRYWWWPLRPKSCPPASTVQCPGNASLSTARRISKAVWKRSEAAGAVACTMIRRRAGGTYGGKSFLPMSLPELTAT
jgi:hypothetical protein